MLLTEAMRATGSSDPELVAAYLNSLETYDGASGHLVFDGKGGVTKDPQLLVVKDGELVLVGDSDD